MKKQGKGIRFHNIDPGELNVEEIRQLLEEAGWDRMSRGERDRAVSDLFGLSLSKRKGPTVSRPSEDARLTREF